MSTLITLEGYLGKNRELRQTQERTITTTCRNQVAEMNDEREVTIPPRDYFVLSLAVREPGRSSPHWYNLVAWSPDRTGLRRQLSLARKGDRVHVTGEFEVYRYTKAGVTREIPQVVIRTYKVLKMKVRREIP